MFDVILQIVLIALACTLGVPLFIFLVAGTIGLAICAVQDLKRLLRNEHY